MNEVPFDGSFMVSNYYKEDNAMGVYRTRPIEIGPWRRNCMNRPLELVISDAEWVGIRMQQEHNKHKN